MCVLLLLFVVIVVVVNMCSIRLETTFNNNSKIIILMERGRIDRQRTLIAPPDESSDTHRLELLPGTDDVDEGG